jgi:hypothetical protein
VASPPSNATAPLADRTLTDARRRSWLPVFSTVNVTGPVSSIPTDESVDSTAKSAARSTATVTVRRSRTVSVSRSPVDSLYSST